MYDERLDAGLGAETYIGIDPGGGTGIAVIGVEDGRAPWLHDHFTIRGGPEGFYEFFHEWGDYLTALSTKVIVEDYIVRGGVPSDHSTLKIIGALEFFKASERIARDKIVFQPPAGRKQAVSDDDLRALDMYLVGKDHKDEKEAVRHVLWYLKKQGNKDLLRRM